MAAVIIVGGGGVAVAGGGDHQNACLLHLGVEGIQDGIVVGKAVVGAEAQVHHISTQLHGVFQSVEDVGIIGTAVAVGEDLHDHQLGIGSHAGEADLTLGGLGVTGNGTGHMDAVVLPGLDVQIPAVAVASGVVKGEGDLPILVKAVVGVGDLVAVGIGGGVQLHPVQHGLQAVAGEAQVRVGHIGTEGILRKCLVDAGHALAFLIVQVQTGVQHGHQHSLAGVALAPGGGQIHQVIAVTVGAVLTADGGSGGLVGVGHIGVLHFRQGPDLGKTAIRNANGHAVDQGGPLGQHLHGHLGVVSGIGDHAVIQLGKYLVLLLHQSLGSGLCACGGQVVGKGRTGAFLGGEGGRGIAVHQGGGIQLHDHRDHIRIGIGGQGGIFPVCSGTEPGLARQLCCGNGLVLAALVGLHCTDYRQQANDQE